MGISMAGGGKSFQQPTEANGGNEIVSVRRIRYEPPQIRQVCDQTLNFQTSNSRQLVLTKCIIYPFGLSLLHLSHIVGQRSMIIHTVLNVGGDDVTLHLQIPKSEITRILDTILVSHPHMDNG